MEIYNTQLGLIAANCYLLIDDQSGDSAIIDPGGTGPALDLLLSKTRPEKLKYILLTHRHYDHISGAAHVKELTGAKVLISEKDQAALYDSEESLASFHGAETEKITDFETVKDGDEIKLGRLVLTVLETPGHTAGSICLICNDVIFSGDTLFKDSIGRTDLPTGDMGQMWSSLRRLKDLKGDYRVFPGHGAETALQYEREHNFYLEGLE